MYSPNGISQKQIPVSPARYAWNAISHPHPPPFGFCQKSQGKIRGCHSFIAFDLPSTYCRLHTPQGRKYLGDKGAGKQLPLPPFIFEKFYKSTCEELPIKNIVQNRTLGIFGFIKLFIGKKERNRNRLFIRKTGSDKIIYNY